MNLLDQLDQPTLLLDEVVARRNIERMAKKAAEKKVGFRPHFKTHQSAEIGEWFRNQGVNQITVSSVEMAEYFAAHGWKDITIAFSVNLRQLPRIHSLSKEISLQVLVENCEAVAAITQDLVGPLGVWIKVDVGNNRTGLDWQDVPTVLQICQAVQRNSKLHLRGLLTHSGQTYHTDTPDETCRIFREGVTRLELLRLKLIDAGILNLEISVGDTPGCTICEDWSGINEVRPGNFVFFDTQQFSAGVCKFEDVAVAVACPVVAKHVSRREVVIYGGAIHLSKDYLFVSGERSFGLPAFQDGNRWGLPIPGGIVRMLSQEHGILKLPQSAYDQAKVGDLVFIIPAHSCLTVQVLRYYRTLTGKIIQTIN
jgi:D-serine deaminase-like pyridoxal phosphate-dependent protein